MPDSDAGSLKWKGGVAPPPEIGQAVECAPGIVLLRLPLPFALDHINAYLFDDGDGWAVIDTGLDTQEARAAWTAALAAPVLRGRPIRRVLVTHHHPDHIDLAGWLCRQWDVPLEITAGELRISGRYADPDRDPHHERVGFWTENGMPEALATGLAGSMPSYLRNVHRLPEDVRSIDIDRPIALGGRAWRPIVGEGHSPCHLSLFDEVDDLLIAGDQVLPTISPNIGVWPDGAQNPLDDYLRTVAPFAELGHDPLVLPSHKQPFRGLGRRVHALLHHHEERLARLFARCAKPSSCYEALSTMFDGVLKREQLGFAMSEGLAHLHYLHGIGCLELVAEDGVRRFRHAAGCTPFRPKSERG